MYEGGDGVKYGPLTTLMLDQAPWRGEDDFPSNQAWADHVEELLEFLREQSQWENFFPRLTSPQRRQRRSALAEAYAAWFLSRSGLAVEGWEEPLESGRTPDLKLRGPDGEEAYAEVKAVAWEGEVSSEERDNGRLEQPKYIQAEARSVDSLAPVIDRLEDASIQLPDHCPTLLVVVDDLFKSPVDLPGDYLRPALAAKMEDFPNLGAVLLLDRCCIGGEIRHTAVLVENGATTGACRWSLPRMGMLAEAIEREDES